ncbi:MAG TPA: hypothetical protein VI423_09020 [Paenisporosarcina sp.]|nr:hypothetical protein [Paenisporosarcina sp.]
MTQKEWKNILPTRRLSFLEMIMNFDPLIGPSLQKIIEDTPVRKGRPVITQERAKSLNCPFEPEQSL